MKTLREFVDFVESETPGKEFNMEELKRLQNKESIMAYMRSFKKFPVSSGEYRLVYDLGNGMVLKLAKDQEAKQANTREYTAAECLGEKYAMKVFEIHHDSLWLTAEKLNPIRDPDGVMDKLFDLLSPEIGNASLTQFPELLAANNRNLDVPHFRKLKLGDIHDQLFGKNQWYTGLIQGLVRCRAPAGDLGFRNWGIRPSTGEFVLLDLGGDGY